MVALLVVTQTRSARAGEAAYSDVAYARVSSLGLASDGLYVNAPLLGDSNGVFFGIAVHGGETNAGTVFRINQDGSGFRVLHHFGTQTGDGEQPLAELVFGPDGWLYGTTELGGTNNAGTIFKLQRDGTGYHIVFHFGAPPAARHPHGHLELSSDGAFYGTTQYTGDVTSGSVFRIRPDGTGFQVLKDFRPEDGGDPDGGVTLGSDGVLYGTCSIGGPDGFSGTVFRINPDGSEFSVLHRFATEEAAGEPKGRLLEIADELYGRTSGLIFKIKKSGSGYARLYTNDFPVPVAGVGVLTRGRDGAIYWASAAPAVFKMEPDGSNPRQIASFPSAPDPEGSFPHLMSDPIYGVTLGTNGAVLATVGHGIYRVQEGGSDAVVLRHLQHTAWTPREPTATLLRGSDGRFYGASETGGFSNAGTIFVLNANGTEYRALFQFGRGTNAFRAPNRLVEASDGYLYGITQNTGVIFRLSREGTDFGILKRLGDPGAPRSALGGLIEGVDGWLYGLSSLGGTIGRGTMFKLRKDGSDFTVLYSFTTSEGYSPIGELVQAVNGMLFGVTQAGGGNWGAIFSISPNGAGYVRLHDFLGGADGQRPRAGLLLDADGILYGTAIGTGTPLWGTVFRIRTDGSGYEVLHRFAPSGVEGSLPSAPLVEGNDEFLYGTTSAGGAFGQGTIFRIRKDGSQFAVLWNFGAFDGDGEAPLAGLTPVGDGSFVGATRNGGAYGHGSVFRFDGTVVRLGIAHGPPVEVSWPASSTTDQLEYSGSVHPADWLPAEWPPNQEGSRLRTVVPADDASTFFRLRRQWQ